MTFDEARAWVHYRDKTGPLTAGPRLEAGFALIAYMMNRALGGSAEMSDFLPYQKPKGASIETFFQALKAGARKDGA